MIRFSRRATVAAAVVTLVLLVCGVAYADNYTYKRTRVGDTAAASITLRKADFPARLAMSGGRIKPDETPNHDSCNGYRPKQSDLVIVGHAESRFGDRAKTLFAESEVELFQTTAMAATDVRRGQRMLVPGCQAQAARQEHLQLVSYALLGHPRCSCDFAVSARLETKTPNPNLNLLSIITAVRKGRFEATVFTSVGKSPNDAQSAAAALRTVLAVQGLAVKAVLRRLHAG
jgi:hypothetical protein